MRVALAGLASAPLSGAAPRRGTFGLSRRAAAVTLLLILAVAGIGDTFRGPGSDRGAASPGRSGSGPNPGNADAITPGHGAGDLPTSGHGTLRVPDAAGAFEIAGAAGQPVAPGHSTAIDLRLVNPHRLPLTVTAVVVRLAAVVAPRSDPGHTCDRRDFAVRQLSSPLPLVVPGGATARLSDLGVPRHSWPRLEMVDRPVNQDGCKGASLRLAYAATGTSP